MSSISLFINYLYCSIYKVVIYCRKRWIKFFRNELGFFFHFEILNHSHYFTCSHFFHLLSQSFSFPITLCHLLSLLVIHCYLLSLVVIRCHLLHHSLLLVVIRWHLLSFVAPLVVNYCHSLTLDVPVVCLFINNRFFIH